jgi:hypothetical protein
VHGDCMDFSQPRLRSPRVHALPLSLALGLPFTVGCSDRTFASHDDEAEASDDGAESATSDQPEPSDTAEPEPSDTGEPEPEPEPFDCQAACANPAQGSCVMGEPCLELCANESPGWSAAIAEAFATCVATDPLCFNSLANCLLGGLHPTGTEHPLRLTGVGFEAYDGLTFLVLHDPDFPPAFGGAATIVDGGFEFEWLEPVPATEYGPLLVFWVDVDGDETCNIADLTGFVSLGWNGDLLAPEYTAELVPPSDPSLFACTLLP